MTVRSMKSFENSQPDSLLHGGTSTVLVHGGSVASMRAFQFSDDETFERLVLAELAHLVGTKVVSTPCRLPTTTYGMWLRIHKNIVGCCCGANDESLDALSHIR
jgi:hypothetical protein